MATRPQCCALGKKKITIAANQPITLFMGSHPKQGGSVDFDDDFL
jgi:hypothetical protein